MSSRIYTIAGSLIAIDIHNTIKHLLSAPGAYLFQARLRGFSIFSHEPSFPDFALPLNLCKILMSSYEGAGWLGSRDLGYSNRDLDKPYEHFSPVTGMKAALSQQP